MNSPTDVPFWVHVDDLRNTLIRSLASILVAFVLCLWFYQDIFMVLTLPLQESSMTSPILNRQEVKRERILNTGSNPTTFSLTRTEQTVSRSLGAIQVDVNHYQIL